MPLQVHCHEGHENAPAQQGIRATKDHSGRCSVEWRRHAAQRDHHHKEYFTNVLRSRQCIQSTVLCGHRNTARGRSSMPSAPDVSPLFAAADIRMLQPVGFGPQICRLVLGLGLFATAQHHMRFVGMVVIGHPSTEQESLPRQPERVPGR